MDTAVALVQAYLHVNGYFTVTEYPLLETHAGAIRTVTDLDLLALRFPGAGKAHRHELDGTGCHEPDAALHCPRAEPDMLVAEVKEGRAEFNTAGHDPAVLSAALRRFGCCDGYEAPELVRELLLRGTALSSCGHRVRLAAFGSQRGRPGPWLTLTLDHVLGYLRHYLTENWGTLRHASFKDPAMGMLATIQKAGGGRSDLSAATGAGPGARNATEGSHS